MNADEGALPPVAAARPSMGLEIPAGPSGLDVLMPALAVAMEDSGPALALLPGTGSQAYRSMLRAAVQPGVPVPAERGGGREHVRVHR